MLDRLSDAMMFGALLPCKECDGGQLVFRSGVGYQCHGDMSEWTKCQFKTQDPARKDFKLPKEYKARKNGSGYLTRSVCSPLELVTRGDIILI